MTPFVVRRVLRGLVVLVLVTLAMFLLLQAGPDPVQMLKANPEYSPADVQRIAHERGWDLPWWRQYLRWGTDFVRGDWGESVYMRRPARDMILERAPVTLTLVLCAQLLAIPLSLLIATALAARRGTRVDRWSSFASYAVVATPPFFIVLVMQMLALMLVHAAGYPILSTGGSPVTSDIGEYARRLTLPVIALTMMLVATWSPYGRSEIGDALDSDYVRVARAKGLPEPLVRRRHAVRNALLPLTTLIAIDCAALFTEAVFVEEVFGLQGLGALLLESVAMRDFVVTLDMLVLAGLLMVVANTLADAVYGVMDARVRAA